MPAWTPELVETAMVEAFRRALLTVAIVPVYADRGLLRAAAIPSLSRESANRPFEVLDWPAIFVAERRHRQWVMVRVSDKARRRNGISEWCREHDVNRKTFDRSCEKAFGAIANGLA